MREIIRWSFWEHHRVYRPTQRPRVADLAERIARENDVSVADLKGPDRRRAVAWPRQELMALATQQGCSQAQVGRFLGGRDHTTVGFGARRHAQRIAKARETGA